MCIRKLNENRLKKGKVMQGIIVVQVSNGERKSESENQGHPLLREFEQELAKLEEIRAEVDVRHAVISHLRDNFLEMLGMSEEPEKTKKEDESTKPEQESTKSKEPENLEPEDSKPVGIADDPELQDKSLTQRLEVLEQAIKNVVMKLGGADMTSRFNQLGELHHNLENCLNCSDEKKETMEHLVELEAAIGEALNFLSTSKLAARFNLLKELRQELEEALAESHTTAG
jgi:hypothetical protein